MTASANNVNLHGNYLTISAGAASFATTAADLATATGSGNANLLYALGSGLTMNSGVDLEIDTSAANFAIDSAVSLAGGGILRIASAKTSPPRA